MSLNFLQVHACVCVVTDGCGGGGGDIKIILFKGTHNVSNEHLSNRSKGIGYAT